MYMRISTSTASRDFCEDRVRPGCRKLLLVCLQSCVSESLVKGRMKMSMYTRCIQDVYLISAKRTRNHEQSVEGRIFESLTPHVPTQRAGDKSGLLK